MGKASNTTLIATLKPLLGDWLLSHSTSYNQLTLEVKADKIEQICQVLRDQIGFEQLTDLCGVDYSEYGMVAGGMACAGKHYAVVYHLLSYSRNQRLRLRAGLDAANLNISSVINVWAGADWFEREAFDLFGIIFHGHPDLRRLLTDYGFIGHPFRKDFPLSGQVEMRYDQEQERVVYQPVTLQPRVLVPRIIGKPVTGKT